MKDTLKDLWYGNVAPQSNEHIHAEEIKELAAYLEKHRSDINNMLDGAGKESLQKLADCYDEILLLENENAFAQGFSLAVRILLESQA